MADQIIVLITCPPDQSEKLAQTLVEERLAGCVNIINAVKSIYLWQGKLCNDSEELLVVKSTRSAWDKLKERVKQLHSYEVPEIVFFPLEDGYKPYMDWLSAATGAGA
jgi:periplasmic divalent cation tolerance protein